MRFRKTIIIALGGSIIIPSPGKTNINFLKKFRKFILKFVKKRYKFIIIAGGGQTARSYQKAASKVVKSSYEDKDWLGILSTRLNAQLLRIIFKEKAYPAVITNPQKRIKTNKSIIIAAGWKPGCSTDYDAVLLAKQFKIKDIIDAGNIPFVYTEDPEVAKKNGRKASAIKEISWENYRKMISSKWIPGLPAPIDPVAAKEAQKCKMKAIIIMGTDLNNFNNLLENKNFKGTIIS